MSSDVRIAFLAVGAILLAAGLLATFLRIRGRGSAAGMGLRVLMVAAGVALLTGGIVTARRGPAVTVRRAPAVGAPAVGAPAVGAPAVTARSGTPVPAVRPDLIVLAGSAFDGCTSPKRPADPPDGTTATHAQMLASDTQTQAFNTATNVYLACLDKAARDFDGQYGAVLNADGLRQIEAMHTRIHNAAVDTDQAVADRFNKQLRIYKARGGV